MTYASVADLPARVRQHVPPHAQKIFLHVFNSVFDSTGDEKRSFASAWSKVHKNYGNPGNKMWKKRTPFKYELEGKKAEKSMDDWDLVKSGTTQKLPKVKAAPMPYKVGDKVHFGFAETKHLGHETGWVSRIGKDHFEVSSKPHFGADSYIVRPGKGDHISPWKRVRKSEPMDAWDLVKAKAIVPGAADIWGRKNHVSKKAPKRGTVTVRPTEFEFKLPFFKKDQYREELKRIPGSQYAGETDTVTIPMNGSNMAVVAKLLHDADFYLVDWTELSRGNSVQKQTNGNHWDKKTLSGTIHEPTVKSADDESETLEEKLDGLVKSHKRKHHPHGSRPCSHCAGLGYHFPAHTDDHDHDEDDDTSGSVVTESDSDEADDANKSIEVIEEVIVKSGKECQFCGLRESDTTFKSLPDSGYCDNCISMSGRNSARR